MPIFLTWYQSVRKKLILGFALRSRRRQAPPPSSAAAVKRRRLVLRRRRNQIVPRRSPCPAVHLAVVLPCVPGGRPNIASDAAPPLPCRPSTWLPPCLASWYRPDAPASSRPAAASSRRVPACYLVSRIAVNAANAYRVSRIAVNAARALPAACSRPAHALLLRPGIISPLTSCFSFSALCCCVPKLPSPLPSSCVLLPVIAPAVELPTSCCPVVTHCPAGALPSALQLPTPCCPDVLPSACGQLKPTFAAVAPTPCCSCSCL